MEKLGFQVSDLDFRFRKIFLPGGGLIKKIGSFSEKNTSFTLFPDCFKRNKMFIIYVSAAEAQVKRVLNVRKGAQVP
jgi:hypothetical protein